MWRWRRQSQDEFSAEIEAHLALETDRLIGQGMPPEEARLAARRAFGSVLGAEERFYESGRPLWLDRIGQHLRYAWKTLRARPGFALAAVLSLALGIGLNTAVFTLLYAVALRPLQLRRPERLVNVYQNFEGRYSRRVAGNIHYLAYSEYLAYRDRSRAFEGISAYTEIELALGGGEGAEAHGVLVTCDYLTTVGAAMALGRAFAAEECARPGAGAVAVLSDGYWRRRLGGDPAVLGRTIVLNQLPFTIIGVAEAGFAGTDWRPAEVWAPVTMMPALSHGRDSSLSTETSWLTIIGRLKPGVTPAAAEAELAIVAAEGDRRSPGRRTRVEVTPAALANSPEVRSRGSLLALGALAMTALVLLMACANVMNLLLARALTRQREIALRLALGASRALLIEQLLTESLLLALLGGGTGLGLAFALPALIRRFIPDVGSAASLAPDLRVLGFTVVVSLSAALGFGLMPALQATGLELSSVLRIGGGAAAPRTMARWRRFIVGAQLAGSALLLVICALFGRAMRQAQSVDLGFVTSGVVSISLNTREQGYDHARTGIVYGEFARRLTSLPGVQSVALAENLPFLSRHTTEVIPEVPGAASAVPVPLEANVVSGGYFETMGIELTRGRAFTDLESAASERSLAVISAALARLVWPSADPVGRRFRSEGRSYVVTGVAPDLHSRSLAEPDGPMFYPAPPVGDRSGLKFIVRTTGPTAAISAAVPDLVRQLDPNLLARTELFEDRIRLVLAPARLAAGLAGVFGGLALALAAFGVYGVVSYGVTQRWHEIGIRVALGASRRQILSLVAGQGTRIAAIGILIGLVVAAGAAQLLRGWLFGLNPLDPVAFIGVGVAMLGVALLATWVPARRAARLDPAVTLREE